jgi:hypothetical protein
MQSQREGCNQVPLIWTVAEGLTLGIKVKATRPASQRHTASCNRQVARLGLEGLTKSSPLGSQNTPVPKEPHWVAVVQGGQ